jgi:hypothetical protein
MVVGPIGTAMVSGGFRVGGGVVGAGGVVVGGGGGGGGVVARATTRRRVFDGSTAERTTGGRVGGVVTRTVVGAVVAATFGRGARFLTTVAARSKVCVVTACEFDVGMTSVARELGAAAWSRITPTTTSATTHIMAPNTAWCV